MSAFICSDKHIATIALLTVPAKHVQEFADRLKSCNIASVNYRYDEKTPKRKCKLIALDDCLGVTMQDLAQLCKCWSYQSCEGELLDYQILDSFLSDKMQKLGYPLDKEYNSTIWSI